MSNLEKELVLRGVYSPDSQILALGNYQIFNQFESHQHNDNGMITNRCREIETTVEGTAPTLSYSTATKYVFSRSQNEKESVELEVDDISEHEFRTIASMLKERVVKKRLSIPKEGYVIEIDIFFNLTDNTWTDGFKIDIEGENRPDQDTLNAALAEAGFIVVSWKSPSEWGEIYNALVREDLTSEPTPDDAVVTPSDEPAVV